MWIFSELVKDLIEYLAFTHATRGDLLRADIEFLCHRYKLPFNSGAYRGAFLANNFVLKFPLNGNTERLDSEYNFIRNMRRDSRYREWFPATRKLSDYLLIQERVDCSQNRDMLCDVQLSNRIEALCEELGIWDVRAGVNCGRRFSTGHVVLFDVDIRSNNRRR